MIPALALLALPCGESDPRGQGEATALGSDLECLALLGGKHDGEADGAVGARHLALHAEVVARPRLVVTVEAV